MLSNVEIHGFLASGNNSKYVYFQSLLHSRVPQCDFYCEQYCPAKGNFSPIYNAEWLKGPKLQIFVAEFFYTIQACRGIADLGTRK